MQAFGFGVFIIFRIAASYKLDKYYQVFGNLYLKFKNKQQVFPGSVGI
jgi:hypothetical protein